MAAEPFGRYQLLHKLATGGMGEVWLARQSGPGGFDRFVAIKRLLVDLAEGYEFVQMFLDEARLAARLNHPNICQVYEFGCERGQFFLAMEYLHGESLSSLLARSLKERRPIDFGIAAFILAEACEGLHFAHERKDEDGGALGLVHRDITPSNLFVTYDGTVKLLDFGIAKAAHRLTHTVAGAIKGKFGYIAPEVYLGKPLDRRADLFAMGVVLWELLVRRRLYKRETDYEAYQAIVTEPTPDPRAIDPTVPEPLARIALKALAKDPTERYQTALELRRELAGYLRSLDRDVDADGLSNSLRELFGQPWIDRRAEALEAFKDSSGEVTGAEVLNPPGDSEPVHAVAGVSFVRRPLPQPTAARLRRSRVRVAFGVAAIPLALGLAWIVQRRSARPARAEPALRLGAHDARPERHAFARAARPRTNALAEAQAPGTLVVRALPSGARVRLDDRPMAKVVPATFDELSPGNLHDFWVSAPGFEPRKFSFRVGSGETASYEVNLLKHPRRQAPPRPTKRPEGLTTDEPINPWGTP